MQKGSSRHPDWCRDDAMKAAQVSLTQLSASHQQGGRWQGAGGRNSRLATAVLSTRQGPELRIL